MKSVKRSCQTKKSDGTSCQAAAIPGKDSCFFHDPDQADKRRSAQSFGGSQNRMKTLAEDAPDVPVNDCRDVVKLISETINQVRRGELDPRIANAVGYLAAVLIKAAEQGDTERRLDDLEMLMKNRGQESSMDPIIDLATYGNP